jgi:hypothetical protein
VIRLSRYNPLMASFSNQAWRHTLVHHLIAPEGALDPQIPLWNKEAHLWLAQPLWIQLWLSTTGHQNPTTWQAWGSHHPAPSEFIEALGYHLKPMLLQHKLAPSLQWLLHLPLDKPDTQAWALEYAAKVLRLGQGLPEAEAIAAYTQQLEKRCATAPGITELSELRIRCAQAPQPDPPRVGPAVNNLHHLRKLCAQGAFVQAATLTEALPPVYQRWGCLLLAEALVQQKQLNLGLFWIHKTEQQLISEYPEHLTRRWFNALPQWRRLSRLRNYLQDPATITTAYRKLPRASQVDAGLAWAETGQLPPPYAQTLWRLASPAEGSMLCWHQPQQWPWHPWLA